MSVPVLLAVDIGSLINVLIILLFILIPAIGQLLTKLKKVEPPAFGPGPQPPQPVAGGESVQDQIEEFLRRASQRRMGGDDRPVEAEVVETPQPVMAQVVPEQAVGGRVNQQVREYMDTSEFTRRGDQMGNEVTETDNQFQKNVQQAFSGEVSSLSRTPGETSDTPQAVEAEFSEEARPTLQGVAAPGEGLAELLGSPENILHAIIMNEVLQPRKWD